LVDPVPPDAFGAGLPAGTVGYAIGVALALSALAGYRAGRPVPVSGVGVAAQLWLPAVLGIDMAPGPPRPAPGGGCYHADLGSPGDAEDFARLLGTVRDSASAAEIAAAAQEWRLPVIDYRPAVTGPVTFPLTVASGVRMHESRGFRVLDLTGMWAGPLATRLLQDLGATVVKIEPSFRPDGFRGHPRLWSALNAGKSVIDLDLRTDRDRFLARAGESDLVIDTFSPRVMPNFGLDELPGGATRVSMPAFGPGPDRGWVAYGTGVHAASGLGDLGAGHFAPGAISYADPVAGLTLALAALAAMIGRERGIPVGAIDTSLAAAIQPLLSMGAAGPRLVETPTVFPPNQNVF
jgi:hypothetical protein